jgi:hypothetical protein
MVAIPPVVAREELVVLPREERKSPEVALIAEKYSECSLKKNPNYLQW